MWLFIFFNDNYRVCSEQGCETEQTQWRLGAELAEQCDPSPDPVLGRNVGVERHGDDIVGGVAGGGQGAAPIAGLVDGHHITHPLGDVLSLNRLQPHLTERGVTEAVRGQRGQMM